MKCSPQTVVFLLPSNFTTRDGSLETPSLTAIQAAVSVQRERRAGERTNSFQIQTHLRQSGDDAIASGKVEVHDAAVSTKNSTKRLKRDVEIAKAEVLSETSTVDDGEQLLSVNCTIVLNKKLCTSTYAKSVRELLATMSLDLTVGSLRAAQPHSVTMTISLLL